MAYNFELEDLTRNYYNPKGKYIGDHLMYFNQQVFKEITGLEPKTWGKDKSITNGDWVIAYDGYVVECLAMWYPFKNSKTKPEYAYKTKFFKFPMCTMRFYEGKTGDHWSNFYAGFTFPNKRHPQGIRSKGAETVFPESLPSDTKRLFGAFVAKGIHPYTAYTAVFGEKKKFTVLFSQNQLNFAVQKLLEDKIVQDQIKKDAIIPLYTNVDNTIKDDDVVNHIKKLLDGSDIGSKTHRENIQWIMELKGYNAGGRQAPPDLPNGAEEEKITNAEDAHVIDESEPPKEDD